MHLFSLYRKINDRRNLVVLVATSTVIVIELFMIVTPHVSIGNLFAKFTRKPLSYFIVNVKATTNRHLN